jgi:NADP-dependent 3-hydroxy acid dehydrogenase YdfG
MLDRRRCIRALLNEYPFFHVYRTKPILHDVGDSEAICANYSTIQQRPDKRGRATIDLLLNGAGFSLVCRIAESRPDEAREALKDFDVGYLDLILL